MTCKLFKNRFPGENSREAVFGISAFLQTPAVRIGFSPILNRFQTGFTLLRSVSMGA